MLNNLELALNSLTEEASSACVLDDNNQILFSKLESLADLGCLPFTIKMVKNFFKLNVGDVVVTNDPLSGCQNLQFFYLLAKIQDDLTLIIKFGSKQSLFSPQVNSTFRIPPTPIAKSYALNHELLTIIGNAPFAPADLSLKIQKWIEVFWRKEKQFRNLLEHEKRDFKTESVLELLKQKQNRYADLWSNAIEPGEQKLELQIGSTEWIRVKITISQQKTCLIDFSGSTNQSESMGLSPAMTEACCYAALMAFTNCEMNLLNEVIALTQIKVPSGCIFQSQKINLKLFNSDFVAETVANLILSGLQKFVHNENWVANFNLPLVYQIQFSDRYFIESLPGGLCAEGAKQTPASGFFWSRKTLQNSIEQIESKYPMLILKEKFRDNQKTPIKGSKGILKEVQVLQDCTLSWATPRPQMGQGKSLNSIQNSKIFVQIAGQEEQEHSTDVGECFLPKDSKILFVTSGY